MRSEQKCEVEEADYILLKNPDSYRELKGKSMLRIFIKNSWP